MCTCACIRLCVCVCVRVHIYATCKFHCLPAFLAGQSVQEVESFKQWEGVIQEREKLAEQFEITFEFEKDNMADLINNKECR